RTCCPAGTATARCSRSEIRREEPNRESPGPAPGSVVMWGVRHATCWQYPLTDGVTGLASRRQPTGGRTDAGEERTGVEAGAGQRERRQEVAVEQVLGRRLGQEAGARRAGAGVGRRLHEEGRDEGGRALPRDRPVSEKDASPPGMAGGLGGKGAR